MDALGSTLSKDVPRLCMVSTERLALHGVPEDIGRSLAELANVALWETLCAKPNAYVVEGFQSLVTFLEASLKVQH